MTGFWVMLLAGALAWRFATISQVRLPTDHAPRQQQRLRAVQTTHTGPIRAVGAAAALITCVVIGPVVTIAIAGTGLLVRRLARARRVGKQHGAAAELPVTGDLVAIGLAGGVGLLDTLAAVSKHQRGPVADALVDIRRRHESGQPVSTAVHDALAPLGAEASRFAALLQSHHDQGAAIVEPLQRWADELRRTRRQAIETEARQLPIRMLAPLLLCVLPAFLLLTVVPIVVEGLRDVTA